MTNNKPRFRGNFVHFQTSHGWGSGYVINPNRSNRPRVLNVPECSLCRVESAQDVPAPMNIVTYDNLEYILTANHRPIMDDLHLLLFPRGHRLDPNASDAQLMLALAASGLKGLAIRDVAGHSPLMTGHDAGKYEDTFLKPCAVYMNPLPGSGRSEPHVHLNIVSALSVNLPVAEPAPWQICRGMKDDTTIARLLGLKFYALLVQGEPKSVAETVSVMHGTFNQLAVPYNLLAYPLLDGEQVKQTRLVVVPRDCEYCPAADQRIAGLELLTGITIPGAKAQRRMSILQRDLAFWQASFKEERQLELERRLRGVFGLPPAGLAVYAALA